LCPSADSPSTCAQSTSRCVFSSICPSAAEILLLHRTIGGRRAGKRQPALFAGLGDWIFALRKA
jgi:hypothetical protein